MDKLQKYYDELNKYRDEGISENWEFNMLLNKWLGVIESALQNDRQSLYGAICNELLDNLSFGYLQNEDNLLDFPMFKVFQKAIGFLDVSNDINKIFFAVEALAKRNSSKTLQYLKAFTIEFLKQCESENTPLNSDEFTYSFALVLKQGFHGMWAELAKMFDSPNVEVGITEMCNALEQFYYNDNTDEIIYTLSAVLQNNENFTLANELLGYTYYNLSMWQNALSYFEKVSNQEKDACLFFRDIEYFWMAFCYGKCKDYKSEEHYYLKALDVNPSAKFVSNNLGYCYYRQKQYDKAIDVFKQCLENKRDVTYATNNIVRTLIAKGSQKEALEYIKLYPNVSKSLKDRAKNMSAKTKVIQEFIDTAIEIAPPKKVELGTKKQQFSNEKILEDELILRLENGYKIFGMQLKVYKRFGEYGRQFIIPVGRIDILAEDDVGDFYVIELKKDAGYDDAYSQTIRYIEWIEKHMTNKSQKVKGIICLNSPTNKLIQKVRRDDRVQLFEYVISYNEVM